VVKTRLHNRKLFSATGIRSRIVKDASWKRLVTTGTLRVINEIDGIKRIKAISARKKASHISP
jgi:nicotinamide-nucleotide adenylyltransferase